MSIGERIQKIRTDKGLTRYRLTQLTGVSGEHIKGIELGTRQPTIDTLQKLSAPLGITLAELFSENGECTYLSERERKLVENLRMLSNEKADVLLSLSEVLMK